MTSQERILAEVAAERVRQDEKWGVQNHPMWYPGSMRDAKEYAKLAGYWKSLNDHRVRSAGKQGKTKDENCAWDGILLEEVFEGLGETRPGLQYAEFVQAASVTVAILEMLNRNTIDQTGHHASCPALDADWIVYAPEACDCEGWFAPRYEERTLDALFDTWGVWDNRDNCWERGFDHNSRGEARAYANRMNEECS